MRRGTCRYPGQCAQREPRTTQSHSRAAETNWSCRPKGRVRNPEVTIAHHIVTSAASSTVHTLHEGAEGDDGLRDKVVAAADVAVVHLEVHHRKLCGRDNRATQSHANTRYPTNACGRKHGENKVYLATQTAGPAPEGLTRKLDLKLHERVPHRVEAVVVDRARARLSPTRAATDGWGGYNAQEQWGEAPRKTTCRQKTDVQVRAGNLKHARTHTLNESTLAPTISTLTYGSIISPRWSSYRVARHRPTH